MIGWTCYSELNAAADKLELATTSVNLSPAEKKEYLAERMVHLGKATDAAKQCNPEMLATVPKEDSHAYSELNKAIQEANDFDVDTKLIGTVAFKLCALLI